MKKTTLQKYFLPYQQRWITDGSRFKISEKSRRIGMTYAQAYEDVRDAVKKDNEQRKKENVLSKSSLEF